MRLSSLFVEFCDHLRVEREAAPKTVTTYQSRFQDFIDFAQPKVGTVLTSHLTPDLCRAYQYALDKRQLKPNSVRVHLAMLSSFCKWLLHHDKIVKNPIDVLIRPKRKRRPPHGVPAWHAVDELLSNGLALRDKALVALLAYGGLRRSEVVALDVGDVDPDFGLRRVLGKGGSEEAVALPAVARTILAEYLAKQRPGAAPRDPLFVCHYLTRGMKQRVGRMAEGRVYKLVKKLGAAHGLEALRPHAFRHACGVELLDRTGGNLRAVQEHLRHRDIQTTTLYTQIVKPRLQQIVGVFDK